MITFYTMVCIRDFTDVGAKGETVNLIPGNSAFHKSSETGSCSIAKTSLELSVIHLSSEIVGVNKTHG